MPVGPAVSCAGSRTTPHCDGVVRDGAEPAVIAICGVAPVDYRLVDPSQPGWRRV